ncbi:DNA adenine methylase [Brevibacillus reuszeri]|nr:DNA adenine methylase [Brevibacillus reuszeri]
MPRILHYPGSKWNTAQWIIENMPAHETYLEPYFGSGAVLFNKPRSPIETVNDLDDDIVNLFEVIRDRKADLADLVRWTPYSREEYNRAYEYSEDPLERARRFLARCWMARWVKTTRKTDWRHVIDFAARPSSPAIEWTTLPDKIIAAAERLSGVQIEKQPAAKVITRHRRSNVLIYCDPPYLLDTRRGPMYKYEMTVDDHIELLEVLEKHTGPAIISGYSHPLYDEKLKKWERKTIGVTAEAGVRRTEVIWINPVAAEHGQQSIFSLPGVESL